MKKLFRDLRRRYLPRKLKWSIIDLLSIFRRIKTTDRVLPDFLIIGAQKSGTTFLFSALLKSDHMLGPFLKEAHYFDTNYRKGETWYRSLFPSRKDLQARQKPDGSKRITGEASPFYLYYPYAAERAYTLSSNLKIIAVLRDPAERAISHYYHSRAWGYESLPIDEAFAAEESRLAPDKERMAKDPEYIGRSFSNHSYVDRGHYARQLKNWEKHFSREQMLILDSRKLFGDTQETLDNVCAFLEIPSFEYAGGASRNTTSGKADANDALRQKIRSEFKAGNDELFEYTGIRF
jgi:hypothetical protein